MVLTNIAAVRSTDRDVRDAVRHTLNSLGLFWEEVDEPDPLKHSVAVFPEATQFVPVTIPSIFVGETALSYYGGEKNEVKRSPPEPAGFMVVDKVKIPYFGVKYDLEGERLLRQAPLYSKDSHLLLGYDLFRNVSYFLRGAESSLGLKRIRTSDRRFNPKVLEELRGVPVTTPLVDLHARFLLFAILFLHKRERLPLIMKQIPPSGYRGGMSISVPVYRTGSSRLRFDLRRFLRRAESWLERLVKGAEDLTFFVGRGEDYTPSKIRELLITMEESGHEVGLLASVRASIDHMSVAEEYEEVATILKRGGIGIRFRGVASTLMDAWKSAAYVEAAYALAGELADEMGFLLGTGYPFKAQGLVWNVPLLGRVSGRSSASRAAELAARWGGMMAVDVLDDLSTFSLIRAARERGLWVAPPTALLERYRAVSDVKGTFRYDRRYLEGKLMPYSQVKDLQLRIMNPEGRDSVIRVDLEDGRPHEIRIPV